MQCLCKNNKSCCICLQLENDTISCLKCKNAVVCHNCISSMLEKGVCDKCPICRQINWKKKIVSKNKIVPKDYIEHLSFETDIKKKNCPKDNLLKFLTFLGLLILTYMAGLLTQFMFFGNKLNYYTYFCLPFMFGVFEGLLLWCCCKKNN